MKRKVINLSMIIGIIIFLFIFSGTIKLTFNMSKMKSPGKVIIIDAGHGGIDGGAVSKNGVSEKDINLSIAKKLMGYLETGGYTCIMIREVDEGLYSSEGRIRNKKRADLRARREIIQKEKADLFLSIHLNAFPQTQYYGAQVFYQNGDVSSGLFAKCVQDELRNILNRGNHRLEKASDSYYILKENKIPSILIECGFLSNPEEEKLLQDEKYQSKIAIAIYSGIEKYLYQMQNQK